MNTSVTTNLINLLSGFCNKTTAKQDRKNKMDIAANPIIKAFLAGSLSGTCSTILFQPLDLVKTRIQTAHTVAVMASTNGSSTQSLGMYSTIRTVLATEKMAGLWKGILPSITRTVPGVGLYFASLHWLKTQVGGSEKPNPVKAVCLGMAARSFAGCVMIPITVLKTRFESGAYNYKHMSTALVDIYSREGLRGLCCGLVPTLVRDAPYSGLYLMFYTQLKQNVVPHLHNVLAATVSPSNAAITHFSCGITAGLLASLVTHPADVVKTRMQLQPQLFKSVQQATLEVWSKSGPRGFLIGLAPRMLRRTLMSAFAWTVYEEIMRRTGLK